MSPALLSSILSSLANLTGFTLVGNQVGDDGFRQVASLLRQLQSLKNLHLCDIGVTWWSLSELEKVLLSCSKMIDYYVYAEKRSFPPADEDITKVFSLTTLRFKKRKDELNELYYGFRITDSLALWNQRLQKLHIKFYV